MKKLLLSSLAVAVLTFALVSGVGVGGSPQPSCHDDRSLLPC